MQNKNQFRGFVFSLFIIWSFLLNSLPVKAQDVVTSDDISGGFTFRVTVNPTISRSGTITMGGQEFTVNQSRTGAF